MAILFSGYFAIFFFFFFFFNDILFTVLLCGISTVWCLKIYSCDLTHMSCLSCSVSLYCGWAWVNVLYLLCMYNVIILDIYSQ